jgi:hypothetical protein
MAHYAFLDENNIVVEVIVGRNEDEIVDGISDWEAHYAEFRPGLTCKRTSYNSNIRKNYASIGCVYDELLDAFILPKPFESWVLNEITCKWEAPTSMPTDDKKYRWDEETTSWVEVILA